MNHETCRHLLESLSDYVDGSLDDTLCVELEHHLESCENCRIVVDTLRQTIYLYQVTAQPPTVPDEVRQRLYQRLDLGDYLGHK